MEQALGNIRNRVDAFGVGEPEIVLSGDTIEVQIPGLTKGTIEERKKTQYCLVDDGRDELRVRRRPGGRPRHALDALEVEPQTIGGVHRRPGPDGDPARLLRDRRGGRRGQGDHPGRPEGERDAAERLRRRLPTPSAVRRTTRSASPMRRARSPRASRRRRRPTRRRRASPSTSPSRRYCVTDTAGAAGEAERRLLRRHPARDASASRLPRPPPRRARRRPAAPTPELDRQRRRSRCRVGEKTKADAQRLAAIAVRGRHVQYCVISSADQNLGCFLDQDVGRASSSARRVRSGCCRVIGQTARLEQRAVIEVIDPARPRVRLDAGDLRHRRRSVEKPECCAQALESQEVVYLDEAGAPSTGSAPW